jgi:hypothetical protein
MNLISTKIVFGLVSEVVGGGGGICEEFPLRAGSDNLFTLDKQIPSCYMAMCVCMYDVIVQCNEDVNGTGKEYGALHCPSIPVMLSRCSSCTFIYGRVGRNAVFFLGSVI